MKKQLLKTAVIAAIVLPMAAQAGVYGRADGVVRYLDNDVSGQSGSWDVGIDKMRWGIVGSEDLGNGMKALYHYEWAMNSNGTTGSTSNNERTRLAYAGLQGGWGKLTIGRNWWPSYFAVWNKTDTGDAHATTGSVSNFSGNRVGKQIAYTTPNFSGFSGSFAGVMNSGIPLTGVNGASSADGNKNGFDVWELNGQYKAGPAQVGLTYRKDERDSTTCSPTCNDLTLWGIGGSYAFGDLSIEANYGNADQDAVSGTSVETDAWAIGATYKMGANQVHGAYRSNSTEVTGSPDLDNKDWYIGFRHFMSKETRVFAEYRSFTADNAGGGDTQTDMLALGLRKDWKL